MSDEPPDDSARDEPEDRGVREVDAWAVISYLLAGVLFYGGIGWLVDWWLGTRGFVAAGIVLGAAGGVALVWLRYGER